MNATERWCYFYALLYYCYQEYNIIMRITDLEKAIDSLNGIVFEEMIQKLIVGRFFFEDDFQIHETGKISGMQHPSKSQIDIWFSYKKEGVSNYYFVAVTKQKNSVFGRDKKAEKDICDMIIEAKKTLFSNITIVFACTQNAEPDQVSHLEEMCKKENCKFNFWGLNVITSMLEHSPTVLSEYLHINDDPETIIPLANYLANKKDDVNLDKQFLHREKEMKELVEAICEDKKRVLIIHGPSGCGKTRLAIETSKQLQTQNNYYGCFFKPNSFSSVEKALCMVPKNKPVILIIDDANIYNFLNQHIERVLREENVFVLMTLRDYLWNDFSKRINFQCFDITLSALKKSEIEDIVKKAYKVTNPNYLKYLYAISKNNLRFALMTTRLFAEKQIEPKTISDVLENYYEEILNESGADKDENLEKTIVAVSLLGRTDIRDADSNNRMCELFDIKKDDFLRLCYKAQDKEFVSIFKHAIIEITDQVLAEYLIYKYVFLFKKADLIKVFDFLYKNKQSRIVWFFNALLNIYGRNEHITFELDRLKDSCLHTDVEGKRFAFFQLFGVFFPNECIEYAVGCIRNKNSIIGADYYQLIANFNDDENYCSQAAYWFSELLGDAKTREPTLDYIVKNFKITVETVNKRYAFEIGFLDAVLEKSKQNKDLSECLFKIIKNYYSYESNYTEYENETRQVYFKRFIIPFSEEYKHLRELLWRGIALLIRRGYYKPIRELFACNRLGDLNEIRKIRHFDQEKAFELYSKLDTTKKEELLLTFYMLSPYKANKSIKELFDELRSDSLIDIYYVYVFEGTRKHLYGKELLRDFRRYFLEKYNNAGELVDVLVRFYNLFCDEDSWKIGTLIIAGFEYLHEIEASNYDLLVLDFIKKCNGNICFNPFDILDKITNKKALLNELIKADYPDQELLISQSLLSMKLNEIDEELYDFALYFNTHRKKIVYGNDNVMSLSAFEAFKPGFIYNVIKNYSVSLANSHFVEHLFTDEKRLEETISYFNGDISLMKNCYFSVLKSSQFCDYHGVYIKYLTLADNTILDDYLKVLYDGKNHVEIRPWIFELNGFIQSFIRFIDKTKFVGLSFFVGHTVNLMPDEIFKTFIQSFVKKHKNEKYKLQSLSSIVFQREKTNTQTILFKTLIEYSIPVDTLKIMQLFDGPHSWTGSVVPYLQSTIKEIEGLILSGEISEPYISFLRNLVKRQEKRIKEEEIAEFNREDY